jgi:hypothetical protein
VDVSKNDRFLRHRDWQLLAFELVIGALRAIFQGLPNRKIKEAGTSGIITP